MLKDLVRQNRSYRRFDAQHPVTTEQIEILMELARLCPSAANLQQLRFYYSVETQTNGVIYPHLGWAGYLRYWDGPEPSERPTAYIIILSHQNVSKYHLIDTGIMAQTMLLGAVELGLGGCQIASVKKAELQLALHLPAEYDIELVIALGKPAETVVVEDVIDPDDIEYWRDDEGVHHVPKRALEDLIIIPE